MKNYIWDFDGMLFDSYPHITRAFEIMMNENGRQIDFEEAKSLLEITFSTCYEYYGVTDEMKARHKELEHDYNLSPVIVPYENTCRTIRELYERGARHFLYTHRGNMTSQHYLEKYDIAKYFDGFVDSSMNFPLKPAPDAIEYICREYGLDKSETIMIGDREIDVAAGKNAGVYSCLFTTDENIETIADYKIKDICDIIQTGVEKI